MSAAEPGIAPGEPDSEGCLLVVAGYADIAPVLGPVTADAAASIMRSSPELGDFFELRFADIGPRLVAPYGHADTIARVAGELTRPAGAASRYYFALVVADRSAAVAEQLLAKCGEHPVIARLPIRCRGLASTDDRRTAPDEAAGAHPAADIVIPAAGTWDRTSLVHELRSYAAELLQDFAAGSEPALTLGQLDELLSAQEQNPAEEQRQDPAVDEQASRLRSAPSPDVLSPQRDEPHRQQPERALVLWRPAGPAAGRRPRRFPALRRARSADQPAVGPPATAEEQAHGPAVDKQASRLRSAPSPDVLSPQRDEPHRQQPERALVLWRPAGRAAGRRPRRFPALRRARSADQPAVGPPATAEEQRQDPAVDKQASRLRSAPSPDVPSPQQDEPHRQQPERALVLWRPAGPAARRPRRFPALRRARSADQPAVGPPATAEEQPRPARVTHLILIGDEDTSDGSAWRRGRSVLLEIDKNLAAAPQAAYRVRVLRSTGDPAMSEPRDAGKLTRHDIRRPTTSLDFPRVLGVIRTAVKRDLAAAGITGSPATRPTIVFFAADVPLANAVTAQLYSELACEAPITWIVPEQLVDLLSPAFEEKGELVINDHQAVAGEVITLLHSTETFTETTGAGRGDN